MERGEIVRHGAAEADGGSVDVVGRVCECGQREAAAQPSLFTESAEHVYTCSVSTRTSPDAAPIVVALNSRFTCVWVDMAV